MPLPEWADLEVINQGLRENCQADQRRIMSGRSDPISSRLEFERTHLGPLPVHAPDLGLLAEGLVHSTGRVRFQTNDYSAPIPYAYQYLTLWASALRHATDLPSSFEAARQELVARRSDGNREFARRAASCV